MLTSFKLMSYIVSFILVLFQDVKDLVKGFVLKYLGLFNLGDKMFPFGLKMKHDFNG